MNAAAILFALNTSPVLGTHSGHEQHLQNWERSLSLGIIGCMMELGKEQTKAGEGMPSETKRITSAMWPV